jgi:hypothetical protein
MNVQFLHIHGYLMPLFHHSIIAETIPEAGILKHRLSHVFVSFGDDSDGKVVAFLLSLNFFDSEIEDRTPVFGEAIFGIDLIVTIVALYFNKFSCSLIMKIILIIYLLFINFEFQSINFIPFVVELQILIAGQFAI